MAPEGIGRQTIRGCPSRLLRSQSSQQDAADDGGLGDEGDHVQHAAASGTDEGIDLADPSDELGPSVPKGG